MSAHQRRRSDRGWRRWLRENWYRDAWLLTITITVIAAVFAARAENAQRIRDIQDSRRDAIRVQCEQQNDRHDRTLAALDHVLAQRLRDAGPVERQRLQTGRASTVLLIEALAPHQDCRRRVRQLIGGT